MWHPRLVRLHDRTMLAAPTGGPVWSINPRTGFLESRAGLTWTGVREYRTPSGVLRVLRRPEQIESAGHLRTLRLLPCTDQHPSGDRDVTPENVDELRVGSTGDSIVVETLDGYRRPVGNVSVARPETIAKMVDAATWQTIVDMLPALRSVHHGGWEPHTGTSLGYNALWLGPHVASEIVSERDDGSVVGEWMGPRGPEPYDVEHVVDPECEVVRKLVRDGGFDPGRLGGNHFAVALKALGGRGGEQSELMRMVDSIDVPTGFDPARSRVSAVVPRQRMATRTRDVQWTVGADRDLPIVSGEWDGDAAAASVFAWAGWPDSPDPAMARRAFLIHDADAPELKGSYKLPIARHRDGRLEIVDAGLRAAASYLPQTDAPQDVLDRARDVLDHYFTRLEATRDAAASQHQRHTMTTKHTIEIGFALGRDALATLDKAGIRLPKPAKFTADEMDANMLREKLGELNESMGEAVAKIAALMQMVSGAEAKMAESEDEYKAKMADMMSKEQAQAEIAKHQEQITALEAQLAAASDSADKLTKERDALLAEVKPLREENLARLRDHAVKLGAEQAKVDAAKTDGEIRRLAVQAHARDGADKWSPEHASDERVAGRFDVLVELLATADEPSNPPSSQPSAFDAFPKLVPPASRDHKDEPDNKPRPSAAAGLSALNKR